MANVKRHYLAEWMADRKVDEMGLVRALNEDPSLSPIDKSQVYRWLEGQLPRGPSLYRIALALKIYKPGTQDPDARAILRHPAQDWVSEVIELISDQPYEEFERFQRMVDAAFRRH